MKSAAFALLLFAAPAYADPVADFYKGQTITFHVGAGPGATYALYAHLLADHMPRHIPGQPGMVANMAGGQSGGVIAANFLHNAAPKNGLTIGMTQQTVIVDQVLRPQAGKFDVTKWNWIGLMAPVRNMLGVWHTAPAQSIAEAKQTEVIVGSTGRASPTYMVPALLNKFLGTRFKIISGYTGVSDLDLAMERGEIHGRGGSWLSVPTGKPEWITDKKFKVVVIDSLTREPDLPDVPRMIDLAANERDRQIFALVSASADFGRAVFAPPGVPADRLAALRAAFDATMKDPAFLADAQKRQAAIEARPAVDLERMAREIIATPPEVVAAAREIMSSE